MFKKNLQFQSALAFWKTGARRDQHITPSYSIHKPGNKNT